MRGQCKGTVISNKNKIRYTTKNSPEKIKINENYSLLSKCKQRLNVLFLSEKFLIFSQTQ